MGLFSRVASGSSITLEAVGSMEAGQGTCFLVSNEGLRIALDCGATPSLTADNSTTQRIIQRLIEVRPQFLVVSHFHYDHWGAIPTLFQKMKERKIPLPTVVATTETRNLLRNHLLDAGVFYSCTFKEETDHLRLIPNSHSVPGSASVLLHVKRNVLYTGDFHEIIFPDDMPPVDVLIVDSTGAANEHCREDKGSEIQRNIFDQLYTAHMEDTALYIALFSTQLQRAQAIYELVGANLQKFPEIRGRNLLQNYRTLYEVAPRWMDHRFHETTSRVVLLTGVWAQGWGSVGETSALVKLATGKSQYYTLKQGDIVVLSGSIPTWSPEITAAIKSMCLRLYQQGARVIVDTSAPSEWEGFAERKAVHGSGHGNMPEIASVINALRPRHILPFHANEQNRQKVAEYCSKRGINTISLEKSRYIRI